MRSADETAAAVCIEPMCVWLLAGVVGIHTAHFDCRQVGSEPESISRAWQGFAFCVSLIIALCIVVSQYVYFLDSTRNVMCH
jgi:hypothetical protein